MRLTNRQLAAHLGVALSGVARAAERRGINRDAQGYYLLTDPVPPQGHVPVDVYIEPGDTSVPQPSRPTPETQAPVPSQPVKQYEPVHLSGEPPAFDDLEPVEMVRVPYRPSVYGRPFRTTVFLSDIHIPLADPFALRAARAFVKDVQPDDLILGGDIADLESASMHPGNPMKQPAMPAEVQATTDLIDALRADLPRAEFTWLDGNHETRPERKASAVFPSITEMMSSRELLDLDGRGIRWLRYKSLFLPSGSPCAFTHGELEGKHHALSMLERYGISVIYGHTHRPQAYMRAHADGRIHGAWGNGCLRQRRVSWTKGPNGWIHGVTIVHHYPDSGFTPVQLVMDRQRFIYGGRLYDGRA